MLKCSSQNIRSSSPSVAKWGVKYKVRMRSGSSQTLLRTFRGGEYSSVLTDILVGVRAHSQAFVTWPASQIHARDSILQGEVRCFGQTNWNKNKIWLNQSSTSHPKFLSPPPWLAGTSPLISHVCLKCLPWWLWNLRCGCLSSNLCYDRIIIRFL